MWTEHQNTRIFNRSAKIRPVRCECGLKKPTGSNRNTRVAAVRFNPTPPAVSDNRNTVGELELGSENVSMARALASWVIRPSSLTNKKSCSFNASSTISKNEVNCDTTRLFREGSLSRMAHNAFIKVSSWKKQKQGYKICIRSSLKVNSTYALKEASQ